jgi:hypothetical protein
MLPFYYYRDSITDCFERGRYCEDSVRPKYEYLAAQFDKLGRCIYCHSEMRSWKAKKDFGSEDGYIACFLKICPSCGWWRAWRDSDSSYSQDLWEVSDMAILKRLSQPAESAPLNDLRRILAHDWRYSRQISPKQAEDLVANVFSEHMDCEIHYLTDSVYAPDGGIDFVLVSRDDGHEIAFQVKRREQPGPERVAPIREFIGAVALSHFDTAFYVSTADRFTRQALAELDKGKLDLKRHGLHIDLVDGRRLQGILRLTTPEPESMGMLRQSKAGMFDEWWENDVANARRHNTIPSGVGMALEDVLKVTRSRQRGPHG